RRVRRAGVPSIRTTEQNSWSAVNFLIVVLRPLTSTMIVEATDPAPHESKSPPRRLNAQGSTLKGDSNDREIRDEPRHAQSRQSIQDCCSGSDRICQNTKSLSRQSRAA